jgi:alanine-glyoxylate transaminase/serine-glyoxylate transaminase/serine-pyruvate transaminase
MLSHLDPQFVEIMDDDACAIGARVPGGGRSFAFAVSGTGTAAMEACDRESRRPAHARAVVVTGYLPIASRRMAARYGGEVRRVEAEWGRAIDPEQVRKALRESALMS